MKIAHQTIQILKELLQQLLDQSVYTPEILEQIHETRTSILVASGVNIEKVFRYTHRLKMLSELDAKIKQQSGILEMQTKLVNNKKTEYENLKKEIKGIQEIIKIAIDA